MKQISFLKKKINARWWQTRSAIQKQAFMTVGMHKHHMKIFLLCNWSLIILFIQTLSFLFNCNPWRLLIVINDVCMSEAHPLNQKLLHKQILIMQRILKHQATETYYLSLSDISDKENNIKKIDIMESRFAEWIVRPNLVLTIPTLFYLVLAHWN